MEVSFELIEQSLDKENNPVFQTEVRIEGILGGSGTGYSKKESQQNAAQMTLKKLKEILSLWQVYKKPKHRIMYLQKIRLPNQKCL